MAIVSEPAFVPPLNLPSGIIQCPECESRTVVYTKVESAMGVGGSMILTIIFRCLAQDREFSIQLTSYPRHTVMEVV